MALSTQPYKGTRDFYPEDMRLRNYIFGKWRNVCQSFGYEEYDGPILEPLDLYSSKTSQEIVNKQAYSFTDRGDRQVIMRPEMTPTVSRMVAARRQELGYPLRLFSIPNCFRYERPQKGRLREFWQLNADIFGIAGIEADIEIIQLADSIMKAFGASPGSYEIRLNSRKLLNKLIEDSGLKTTTSEAINIIDSIDKHDKAEIITKLEQVVMDPPKLIDSLKNEKISEDLQNIAEKLKANGVEVKLTPSLARGFEYYTDIVFEVFDTDPANNRSMFGGGRYDGLVSMFGAESLPTVGFGMGDLTLINFIKSHDLVPDLRPSTDLAVLTVGQEYSQAAKLANNLRGKSLNVSLDVTDRKLEKKLKSADKLGIRWVLFVGEDEVCKNSYTLKDLSSGNEAKLDPDDIASAIKGQTL